ncbi:MAG: hypothetical protein P1V97_24560 [Planctomycetota bacterium]|nr:hypothetical protein [Planctomycetota bacterium]
MGFEEIAALLGNGSDLVRQRLSEEIRRLEERGLIESKEADVLKDRFIQEVDKQARRSFKTAKNMGTGVGSIVRELLDLPSRSELQKIVDMMDSHLRDAARPQASYDVPIHNPGTLAKPSAPLEILPGIHTWSIYNDEKGLFFNSYCVETKNGPAIIDPVDPGNDKDRNAILDLGEIKTIIITNRNHVRAASWLAKATKASVFMHVNEEPATEITVDERVKDGDLILDELRVIELPGKSPGEIALIREEDGGQLFIGDALIGRPAGSLSLLPDAKLDDPLRLKRSVRNLIDEQFDALLLADGASVLSDAALLTHAFLRML